MREFVLSFRDKPLRVFPSLCSGILYILDSSIKILVISLIMVSGFFPEIFSGKYEALGGYVGFYLFVIVIWGALLLKYFLSSKKPLEKTSLDFLLIGVLFFALISTFFSDNKVFAVFGSLGTWQINILTLMCIALLFYAGYAMFGYARGVKWLVAGKVFAAIIVGVFYSIRILNNNGVAPAGFIESVILSIPLLVSGIFFFRRIGLKLVSFAALLFGLFLASFYAEIVQDTIFLLGLGVLALLVVFYFSFWVRKRSEVFTMLQQLVKGRLGIFRQRRHLAMFVLIVILALWILLFGSFLGSYYGDKIGPFVQESYAEDITFTDSIKTFFVGENDLRIQSSGIEILNMANNYGIILTSLFVLLLGYVATQLSKLFLRFVYKGNWKNTVFISGLFILHFGVMLSFFVQKVHMFFQLDLVFVTIVVSILGLLIQKRDAYQLGHCRDSGLLTKPLVRVIGSIFLLGITGLMLFGILQGFRQGIFVS